MPMRALLLDIAIGQAEAASALLGAIYPRLIIAPAIEARAMAGLPDLAPIVVAIRDVQPERAVLTKNSPHLAEHGDQLIDVRLWCLFEADLLIGEHSFAMDAGSALAPATSPQAFGVGWASFGEGIGLDGGGLLGVVSLIALVIARWITTSPRA